MTSFKEDRIDYCRGIFLGSHEAIEYLNFEKEKILRNIHAVSNIRNYDSHGINSIRDMAVLEFIQRLIDISNDILTKQGDKENGRTTNGEPTLE